MFSPKTWCVEEPFGYRVEHHEYFLTSCPGHISLKKQCFTLKRLSVLIKFLFDHVKHKNMIKFTDFMPNSRESTEEDLIVPIKR